MANWSYRRRTIVMGVRHSGQPLSTAATASAQLSQNREWTHGTRATPVREAIKRTSQQSVDSVRRLRRRVGSTCLAGWRRHVLLWVQLLWSDVVVADIGSDVKRLGVCAEAMADRTEELQFTVRCSVVSYRSMHALMRTSFWISRFFFWRRMLIPVSGSSGVRHTVDCRLTVWRWVLSWAVQFIRCSLLRSPDVI